MLRSDEMIAAYSRTAAAQAQLLCPILRAFHDDRTTDPTIERLVSDVVLKMHDGGAKREAALTALTALFTEADVDLRHPVDEVIIYSGFVRSSLSSCFDTSG